MNNNKLLVAFFIFATLISSTVVAFAEPSSYKAGAVYAMTNDSEDNQIAVFDRAEDGTLTLVGSVSTGGTGSGGGLDPLGSQGSLVLSHDNNWLLAVNAGSNEISVFSVLPDGLELMDKVDSWGDFPVSITIFHDLVYVLNAESANIAGFYLNHWGQLIALEDSVRMLGGGTFSQVGFDLRGNNLVITDRGDQEILVYSIDQWGLPLMNPVTSMSEGGGPFGFIFGERNELLVSEAGSGAVSSYEIEQDDSVNATNKSVANGQAGVCWIAGNPREYIYTANTGSQTISAYRLGNANNPEGKGTQKLVLLDATAGFGNRPIDMDISENGRYLYALDPAEEAIDVFAIEADGRLTDMGTASGEGTLLIYAQGIAVR